MHRQVEYIDYRFRMKTDFVTVTAEPFFLEEHSKPMENVYVWAYRIRIENHGPDTIRLINRYWQIADSFGVVQEVHGAGVVGEQPVIKALEFYEYTSFANLSTPSGLMVGHYEMETEAGKTLKVAIPAFSLDCPLQTELPN